MPSYHTIPYHTVPYRTIPYRTVPYHTILYYTILYYTQTGLLQQPRSIPTREVGGRGALTGPALGMNHCLFSDFWTLGMITSETSSARASDTSEATVGWIDAKIGRNR